MIDYESFQKELEAGIISTCSKERTYQGYECASLVNGDGIRTVLWFSGCNHFCDGCHNPSTWDPNSGEYKLKDIGTSIMKSLDTPFCSGITFSGGDPLHPRNRAEAAVFAKLVKKYLPNKTIWLYTGYEWDDIKHLTDILEYVDVLVDGKFKKDLAEINYPWAGSTNQKVIDVHDSLEANKIILHKVHPSNR